LFSAQFGGKDRSHHERFIPDPAFSLHLGQTSSLPAGPEAAVLDYVPNPRRGQLTGALCRARIHLAVPGHRPARLCAYRDRLCPRRDRGIKSLKLFLGSFRNHAGFHEDVTVGIGQRLFDEMRPKWLRIGGYWYPRGGIPIDVFWQSGPVPEGLWVPDQGVASYRGRG
jgi:7-cyano-7-deazaguanine reductase